MGWDDLGIPDMNDIPDRYLVNWHFFNAFFEAFQERADYVEDVARAVTYDDLILTGPQISATELRNRLATFNTNIRGFFQNNTWYQESSWNQLSNFTSQSTLANKTFPTLGVITLTEWDETALRALLTDDVYDLIFEDGSFDKNFRPSYWSGIYKLINEVLLYRDLSISVVHTPAPTEPILYLNGQETFNGSDTDLSTIIIESIFESNIIPNGNRRFAGGEVSFNSDYIKHSSGDVFTTQSATVNYFAINKDPFCKTPALMDIQLLTWRDLGTGIGTREFAGTGNSGTADPTNGLSLTQVNTPFFSSISRSTVNGVVQPFVWVPSQSLALLDYAENPHLSSNYDMGTGFTNIEVLAGIPDIRINNTVSNDLAVPGEPDGPFHPYESEKADAEFTGEYYLNMAMCALPQSEFEFPAE